MGPLSLKDIWAWLEKAMADLIQHWGFPLGLGTFRVLSAEVSRKLWWAVFSCWFARLGLWGYGSRLLQEVNGSSEPADVAGFGTKGRKIPLNPSAKSLCHPGFFWERLYFAGRTERLLCLQQQMLASWLVQNNFSSLCFKYSLPLIMLPFRPSSPVHSHSTGILGHVLMDVDHLLPEGKATAIYTRQRFSISPRRNAKD